MEVPDLHGHMHIQSKLKICREQKNLSNVAVAFYFHVMNFELNVQDYVDAEQAQRRRRRKETCQECTKNEGSKVYF